jgi:hypothetical protein
MGGNQHRHQHQHQKQHPCSSAEFSEATPEAMFDLEPAV